MFTSGVTNVCGQNMMHYLLETAQWDSITNCGIFHKLSGSHFLGNISYAYLQKLYSIVYRSIHCIVPCLAHQNLRWGAFKNLKILPASAQTPHSWEFTYRRKYLRKDIIADVDYYHTFHILINCHDWETYIWDNSIAFPHHYQEVDDLH